MNKLFDRVKNTPQEEINTIPSSTSKDFKVGEMVVVSFIHEVRELHGKYIGFDLVSAKGAKFRCLFHPDRCEKYVKPEKVKKWRWAHSNGVGTFSVGTEYYTDEEAAELYRSYYFQKIDATEREF